MFLALILSAFIAASLGGDVPPKVSGRNFVYDVYDYDVWFPIVLNETTEQILDFREASDDLLRFPSRVHVSTNDSITTEYPLLITATQQKGVSSWELPLSAGRATFTDMARTLCPHDSGRNQTSARRPRVEISTASPRDVTVNIKLRRVTDFFLELDKEASVTVLSPSSPKYYYFSFDAPAGGGASSVNSSVDSVLLTIESDDDICAIVSIQNNSCPVFDNEHEILYRGYHFTLSRRGGVTLTRGTFPQGFYVAFVVKLSDSDCDGGAEAPARGNRTKHFRILAVPRISLQQYMEASAALLSIVLGVYVLVVLLGYCSRHTEASVLVEELAAPSAEIAPLETHVSSDEGSSQSDRSVRDAARDAWDAPTLDQLCRAQPKVLRKQANRYVWGAMTLAIVYTLPVLQLLITYQNMALSTGDEDLCYYNFLCAHPLGSLADSNHVLSNAPYVILGAAFVLQVHRNRQQHVPGRGIPPQQGLLHALGLSLAMEGILSACYHLCPNKMNFQFDSSFMYVMAVVWLTGLYRRRHADLAAPAHRTFAVVALLIATGVFGITFPTLWFWGLFTAAHLAACLMLTVHLYYYGQLKLDRATAAVAWSGARAAGWAALRMRRRARAALLGVMNGVNWALAATGLYNHNGDFARHLLAILLGNTLLYTSLYIGMKLIQRERVSPRCWALILLSAVAWAAAISFFLNGRSKWRETPAHSRTHNAPCSAFGAYDTHDLWHLCSAAALYLSFNLLLHIDQPLRDTPRHLIAVF